MDTVDRIFSLLDKTDMEQQVFAAEVGVSDDTASNWRRRKSASYAKYLPQIAEVLGTTVEYLLTGEQNNSPATETRSEAEKEALELFSRLTPEEQRVLLAQMRGLAGDRE